jgi:DegV family protein with EDD domain
MTEIPINYTFCTEASLRGLDLSPELLREAVAHLGDSLIVAGEGDYARLHIHTDQPQLVFATLERFGAIERTKAENMREQYARHLAEQSSSSLALVVDSSCDLPVETLLLNQIRVVPVRINHGEKSYLDRVEITPESVYRQMGEGAHLQTSQPAASSFSTAFAAALAHHDHVLALTLSSKLSGTYQAAQSAAEPFAGSVQVFDTLSGAGGHGLLVRLALRALKRGDDLPSILLQLQRHAPHTQLIVSLETIDYAQRSGRLPWYKAGLARLLGRVPLLALEQGRIVSAGVARKGEARLDFLVQTVLHRAKGLGSLDLIISHADAAAKAHSVAERLQHLAPEPIPILAISPTVGVHVGPGTVAVAFLAEEGSALEEPGLVAPGAGAQKS